uniref:Uncharacterized protein n=1 Tax=Caenorhabditis japonica TaxID=281687 RepID=A0A8R1IZ87_CAEJA
MAETRELSDGTFEGKEEPMETDETASNIEGMPVKMETDEPTSSDAVDSFARFEELLKKTENFSHCLSSGDAKLATAVPKDGKRRGRPSKASGIDGDHRHRKTEQEEDEEMVADASKGNDLVIFDKSPFYIENGEMRDYQVRGLNWLASLHHNNINGILADEMVKRGGSEAFPKMLLCQAATHVETMEGPSARSYSPWLGCHAIRSVTEN